MDAKRLAEALKNLDAQSFRPGDSLLASTINHPIDAVGQLGNWIAQRTNTAAGIPDQYDNPNPLLAPKGQEQAAFELAGMAQLGSMPFAPKSAGGTLGTFIGPKASTWGADKAAAAAVDDNLNSSLLAKYLREGQLTPQEIAQYETNAVQMTDSGKHYLNLANANAQGGTPESRAVDLGFDTPAYHGTNADIKEFDYKYTGNGNDQFGSGFYTDTRPNLASGYANGEGANVYPLMVNIKKPLDSEFEKTLTKKQITDIIKSSPNIDDALSNYGDIDYEGKAKVLREAVNSNYDYQDDTLLKNLHPLNNDFYSGEPEKFSQAVNKATGYDSVKVNFDDGQHLIPWFTNQIRSRFAAFDPLRKDSANLLASYLLPATMLGFGMAPQDDRQSLIEALRNGN